MAERLDQLIQFLLRETISPILQPVENINSNKAFSIGLKQASLKCSISLSVRNFGIRFPCLGILFLQLDFFEYALPRVTNEIVI
jgi:hypothetical protein